MYDEMKFLFNIDNNKMRNNIGYKNINLFPESHDYNKLSKDIKTYNERIIENSGGGNTKEIIVRYKGKDTISNNEIKDFLNDTSYFKNDNNGNQYVNLIEKLENDSSDSVKFGYKELAYLEKLGVYPLNRMIVLRRFDEGVEVRHNLNEMNGVKPISTIIGWVDPEEDKLLSIGFSEKWENQNKLFWDKISEIVKQETGIKLNTVVPIPGWGQGFLYQFLKSTGLVNPDNYDSSQIPIGDPNVLKVSPTRDIEGQGIDSNFTIKFETSYEQKFINDIDPGSAFLDIIHNSLRMGTSDMNFYLSGEIAKNFMEKFNNDSGGYINGVTQSVIELTKIFFTTINSLMGEITNEISSIITGLSGGTEFTDSSMGIILNGLNAGLYRYRWDLRSSLAITTGQNTTPWHITVGHPLNPILSMGNILLDSGKIEFNNELGFNDLPTSFNLSFDIKQGRPLGKQEIMEVLNNSYSRVYVPPITTS